MGSSNKEGYKVLWSGRIISVQPRIRLTRSFDERYHSNLGYVLRVTGQCDSHQDEFLVALGKKAHEKHQFSVGMELSGISVPVDDPCLETATFYKTSKIKILRESNSKETSPPPFLGPSPSLETYRERGHRRLDLKTYESKCSTCIWGCRMPVEIILDQWDQTKKKYRYETFCYGPKSCPFYRAGATRKVPGRRGMSWEEEDWVDEESISHRGPDD